MSDEDFSTQLVSIALCTQSGKTPKPAGACDWDHDECPKDLYHANAALRSGIVKVA